MTNLREQLERSLHGAYTIERELGGGGMSRVFLAVEVALNRRVVVKLLPSDLVGSLSVERFRREISLAAQLQHPHIVPLFSAGEADGLPYYVMPFVEGESLRSRLAHGELPIADVIAILRDVAKALAYAHGKGIVHRDIKPDNVLLAGNSAMVADLGVAKAVSDSALLGGGSLTSVGVTMGTPAYMAPEQAAADPSIDWRADIYAFGAMAYEMIVGHSPFAGRSPQAMLAAHTTESPLPIDRLRPTTPALLASLIMRCLAKRPADRPQSALEILQTLDALAQSGGDPTPITTPSASAGWRISDRRFGIIAASIVGLVVLAGGAMLWRAQSTTDPAGRVQSVAILPFENKSGDTAFDYLRDAVTDHVRDALNANPALAVKARGSSQQMTGHSPKEVGKKLDVGVVLLGTVNRSNGRLHLTAELVRTSDENGIWSATFDGRPSDLVGIQDTIVHAISGVLRVNRVPGVTTGSADANRGTNNFDAYTLFVRGRYALDRLQIVEAIGLFRRAVAIDRRFARAFGYLAIAYAQLPTLGSYSVDSTNVMARAAADTALSIDSTVAEAYIAQSTIIGNEFRLRDAVRPAERAFALDSTNADVLTNFAFALIQAGPDPRARTYARRAAERDPLSGTALGIYSYALFTSRDFPAAIAEVRIALALDSANVLMHQALGYYYAFVGQPDSAARMLRAAVRMNPSVFAGRSSAVLADAIEGRWADAARERAMLEHDTSGSRHYKLTIAALAFGDSEIAMRELDRAVADHEGGLLPVSIACDPLFDPLKSNPSYQKLLERLQARPCSATARWPFPLPPRVRSAAAATLERRSP